MHPILFRLGPLDIHTYGVLVAAGFLLGLTLAGKRAKADGLDPRAVSDLGIWLIVAGMGGAKLFHVVFFWDEFVRAWRYEGLRSLREGFVFYGGFIGAIGATILFAHKRRLPLWKLADVCAPSVALGHAFGRLGCYFNGCCFGTACDLPWSVRFPDNHMMHSAPVHPTQLYEVLGNFLLFGVLSASFRRKQFDGQVWWWYVLGYGAMRFTIEFVRGDYTVHYFGVFTIAHLIATGLMLTAAIGLWGDDPLAGSRAMTSRFMRAAIRLAERAVRNGTGGPFGAVVVRRGKIVGRGQNTVLSTNDPTAHAEVNAIRDASARLGRFRLDDCELYTSCEPCPMCLAAIQWARLRRVHYAATRHDAARAGFDDARFYREVTVPMRQALRAAALPAFAAWERKTDKTPY